MFDRIPFDEMISYKGGMASNSISSVVFTSEIKLYMSLFDFESVINQHEQRIDRLTHHNEDLKHESQLRFKELCSTKT